MNKPRISDVMITLYGAKIAETVAQRLDYLDPEFNQLIQDFAYDVVWSQVGGNTLEALKRKSIATVSALIAANREEQTRIHLTGFFHLQGNISEAKAICTLLRSICGNAVITKAESTLVEAIHAFEHGGNKTIEGNTAELPLQLQHVIRLAAQISISDKARIEQTLTEITKYNTLSVEEISNLFKHLAIYCGFPAVMDGFAVLRQCRS